MNSKLFYHATRKKIGEEGLIPGFPRTINGVKQAYVFATPYISKTLMFAFDWNAGEAILGGAVPESDDQYILICNASKTLQKQIALNIYAFKNDGLGFVKALNGDPYSKISLGNIHDTREYVTTQNIPRECMYLAHHFSSIEQLKKFGLHIYATEKTCEELIQQNFLSDEALLTPTNKWLESLVKQGLFERV